jgi:hypothetical protein
LRHHDEDRLVVKRDAVCRQDGIIASVYRTGIVAPGDIGRGEHANNSGSGAHRCEVNRFDSTARNRCTADREMQRPFGLADIIDIDRTAADVTHRRVMRRGHADSARRSFGRDISSVNDLSD